MKTLQKILVILVISVCTLGIMPQNYSMAANVVDVVGGVKAEDPSNAQFAKDFQGTISKLLGFLQIASGLIAILMIALTGFNYIISTPEIKEEMKKKMLPIIIGLVLVFGAVSLAKFILGVVGG